MCARPLYFYFILTRRFYFARSSSPATLGGDELPRPPRKNKNLTKKDSVRVANALAMGRGAGKGVGRGAGKGVGKGKRNSSTVQSIEEDDDL